MREHERAVHDSAALPPVVDRATFDADLDRLRAREKAHTREADAIAAQRRRMPMVEVDASITVTGPDGPVTLLETFEGRKQLARHHLRRLRPRPARREPCLPRSRPAGPAGSLLGVA
ncbi:DUF899 family protein [Kribbella sp. NPDC000426]|uniref:DUF899 family protein n=1 Tax=Kribbella sp. NPDC000426 TaxID=3154255 RepID=UPI0033313A0A